jgi:hypothetical protein
MKKVLVTAIEVKLKSVSLEGLKELIRSFEKGDEEFQKARGWATSIGKADVIARRFSKFLLDSGVKNSVWFCQGYVGPLDPKIEQKFRDKFPHYKEESTKTMKGFFSHSVVVVDNLVVDILAVQFSNEKVRIRPLTVFKKEWKVMRKMD